MPTTPALAGAHDVPGQPVLPRGWLVLTGTAALVIIATGLNHVSEVAGPIFLALVLTVVASPIARRTRARGLPIGVSILAAVLVVYGGFALLAGLLLAGAGRFASMLPDYADRAQDLLESVRAWFAGLGFDGSQIGAMTDGFDPGQVAARLLELLQGFGGLVANLAFVLALVLFTILDAVQMDKRLGLDAPAGGPLLDGHRTRARPETVAALAVWARRTRRYFMVATVFGIAVALVDWVFLLIIGIPGAALWGLIAFITNYIPNVGFLIGLVPPAVLALLEGGPSLMILVIVVYSIVNIVIQSFIQPRFVGRSVGLSASVTFLSLIVWSMVLGPLGAVLAIPLTLFVKALLVDADPASRWIGSLVGDEAPLPEKTLPTERTPEP